MTDAMLHSMPNQFTHSALAHIQDVPDTSGVYCLVHARTGKRYVGSAKKMRRRLSGHFHEMRTGRRAKSAEMCRLFSEDGAQGWTAHVLAFCAPAECKATEQRFLDALQPELNVSPVADAPMRRGTKLSAAASAARSAAALSLWQDPVYRARAVAARKGKAYNKGYKCTTEQTENRRRAARIAMMRRWYADAWIAEYLRRYPEHAEDVRGY